MAEFTCEICGDRFTLPPHVLERYPGWTPRHCRRCRPSTTSASGRTTRTTMTADPTTGVFTDGACSHNPGPGGWGAVYVINDEIVAERKGYEDPTTNNRMELTALIEGVDLVPGGEQAVVYSDSRYAVQAMNEWAAGWEKRGWKRKSGPVENLDLIKKLYYKLRKRPELELRHIPGHAGHRWNEYADELATSWRA